MMLLSAPHSAEKFSAPIPGLRSLLLVPDGCTRGVVTRAAVAAARGCAGDRGDAVQESRDVVADDTQEENMEANQEEEEEEDVDAKEEEEEDVEAKEEEEEGCWVSYGRRSPGRLLPPPMPSLIARGTLRRTRTGDGRLVIRIVPVVRPECIRARRRGGRLTMQLVEREGESPEPIGVQEPDDDTTPDFGEGIGDDTAAPAIKEGVGDVQEAAVASPEMMPAPMHLTRVPSVGCFEDVFKYSSIASTSLHQMPRLRMVH